MCKLIAPYHVIQDPRLLECGNSACYSCIVTAKDTDKNLKCTMCNGVHKIPLDQNKLLVNKNLQNFLKLNFRQNLTQINNFTKNFEDAIYSLEGESKNF